MLQRMFQMAEEEAKKALASAKSVAKAAVGAPSSSAAPATPAA
jgi:hypothetical protein